MNKEFIGIIFTMVLVVSTLFYFLVFFPVMYFVDGAIVRSDFSALAKSWPAKGVLCSYADKTINFISFDKFTISDGVGGRYEKDETSVRLLYDDGKKEVLNKFENTLIREVEKDRTCTPVWVVAACSDTTTQYFECNI